MRQRLISGIFLAAVIIGGVLFDGYLSELPEQPLLQFGALNLTNWLFRGFLTTLILLTFAVLATREMIAFVSTLGFRPLRAEAHFFGVGLVVFPYFWFNAGPPKDDPIAGGMVWIALAIGVCFFSQAARRGTHHALVNVAATVFMIVFIGGMLGYMVKLRMELGGAEGAILLLFSMLVVKMTDVGAYFVGRATGKHKLIEWLSPKKTWEGFWGGIVTATAISVGMGWVLETNGWVSLTGWAAFPIGYLVVGPILAVVSVGGDLAVSLLKRDVALKDSGDVIPGMGGVLDVLDSPLLTAPVAWLFWTKLVAVNS